MDFWGKPPSSCWLAGLQNPMQGKVQATSLHRSGLDLMARYPLNSRKSHKNEPNEGKVPFRPTSNLVARAIPTQSVRELSERRESEAAGDDIVLLDRSRSGGGALTAYDGFNTTVRSRQSLQTFHEEQPDAAVSAIADAYYVAEMKRRAEERAEEVAQIRTGKLIRL